MIKTPIHNPAFPAPTGYRLAPAIQLNLKSLNADSIEIDSIDVLQDNVLEVTFHIDVCHLAANIDGYLDMEYPDTNPRNLTKKQYRDAVAETESHMFEWAIDKLINQGIKKNACRNIKITIVSYGYTPVEIKVQFLLEPNSAYSIDPWVNLVFSPNAYSNELYASTSVINEMRQHFSPANSGAMPLRKFSRELFYIFPWYFRWRQAALKIDIIPDNPNLGETKFSFRFNHTSPSCYSADDIKAGHFPIPLFQYPARPVI